MGSEATRERLARRALHAYPPAVRKARGAEIVSTVMDASGPSWPRFARELIGLVRHGLLSRSKQQTSAEPGRLIADGVCLGALWLITLDLTILVAQKLGGLHDSLLSTPSLAALGVILAAGVVGYDRLAGAGAIVWTAIRLPDLFDHNPTMSGVAPSVLPLLCFATLLLAPRQHTVDVRRLAWLAVPAGLVGAAVSGAWEPKVAVAIAACVVVFAVARGPHDPRPAIACGLAVTYIGLQIAWKQPAASLLFLAATPAAVAFAFVFARSRRRQQGA